MMGEPVFHYIARLRLERAARWMRIEGETPITAIAYELGFANCASFSKAFKDHFGLSPTAWKEARDAARERNGAALSATPVGEGERNIFFGDKSLSWQYEIGGRTRVRVQIRDQDDAPIVYLRYIGASLGDHERFEYAYESLMQWASSRGIEDCSRKRIYAVYHDNPLVTEESRLRISAGFEAPPAMEVSGNVGKMVVPGGKYAVAHFEYETREEYMAVYLFLSERWLRDFGYSPDIHRYDYICFLSSPSDRKLDIALSVPIRPI
jgi:AraC family transcriptional regulator